MPTMLNPRSQALLNANPRLLTSPNSDIFLSASTPIFHISNTGDNSPATITFNAILIAMQGTVTFSCNGGTLTNIVGNTAALNFENMPGDTATVYATITYRNQTYTDSVEISKVYDGAAGGTGLNNALMYAYQRSATMPSVSPGAVQYSFTSAAIVTNPLANGWQKTIPSGTLPIWITAASASSSGTTDNVGANEWSTPVILSENGDDGINGLNSATITIYQRTASTSAPAVPSANATYTFNPAGTAGLNNGWTTTVPPIGNGKYLWASTATAVSTTATDTIPPGEWAAPQMMVQDGANGQPGARGNVQVARAIPGSTWSDSEAVLAISSAGYGVPQNRDIVTLYNNSANFSQQKYYDGSAWQVLAAYFPGGVIVDGTVDATALKANTITADKIKAGAITASSLTVSSNPDNILPDPAFRDLAWWNQAGRAVGNYVGQNTPWKTGRTLQFGPNGNVDDDKLSTGFTMVPGATYRLELQAFLTSDYVGDFTVAMLIPAVEWVLLGVPNSGYFWPDGLKVGFTSLSPKGFQTFSTTYTVPDNGFTFQTQMRIRQRISTGTVEIGGISITRVSDGVLIKDAAITADKLNVNSLTAVSTFVGGDLQLGPNGRLRQGQSAYDTGNGIFLGADASGNPAFSMRSGTNKYVRIRPSTDTFEMNGVKILQPVYDTFAYTAAGGGTIQGANNQLLSNSVTLNITGNNGPFKVSWTYSRLAGGIVSTPSYIDPNPNTTLGINVGPASNTTINFQVSAVITGSDGRTLNYSDVWSFQFGSV